VFSDFIELIGAFVLVLAILQITSDRLYFSIKVYAIQSFFVAISILSIGIYSSSFDLYVSSFLTLVIKTFVIPYALFKTIDEMKIKREIKAFVNITNSLMVISAIIIFTFLLTRYINLGGSVIAKEIFPISLSIIFIGAFIMVSRQKPITQLIGFLTLENGIMLVATSVTYGMPLIVEIGIFFDVIVGATMASLIIHHINHDIDDIDEASVSDFKE
jgi:hydrogenase-4 component E